jgi:hypothetical protein
LTDEEEQEAINRYVNPKDEIQTGTKELKKKDKKKKV